MHIMSDNKQTRDKDNLKWEKAIWERSINWARFVSHPYREIGLPTVGAEDKYP